jgi:predicted TIM-barrel fold metal-dependent hydrolase
MSTCHVISADSHVNPPPTFWREYLPARFRDAAPQLEQTDAGDFVVFEGRRTAFDLITGLAGTKAEDYKRAGKLSEARRGGWVPEERLADLELDGVDAEALFGGGPLVTVDPALHRASYRAYNTWLADFCRAAPDRFLGVAYLPMWDVDEAIAELEFAAERGLQGVVIPAFAPAGVVGGLGLGGQASALMIADPDSGRNYYDPEYDRFWQAAVELGLPIHMHLGAHKTRNDPDKFLSDMTISKVKMAEPIAQFVFSGLLQRFPDLKLVSVESGVGWFAFVAEYMDHLWRKHRFWTHNRLEEPPSFYMDRQVFGTFLEDRAGILARNLPGGHNIMWSSDYPHSETSWPHSQEYIDRLLAGVPEPEKEAIIGGTARRLYDLSEG